MRNRNLLENRQKSTSTVCRVSFVTAIENVDVIFFVTCEMNYHAIFKLKISKLEATLNIYTLYTKHVDSRYMYFGDKFTQNDC